MKIRKTPAFAFIASNLQPCVNSHPFFVQLYRSRCVLQIAISIAKNIWVEAQLSWLSKPGKQVTFQYPSIAIGLLSNLGNMASEWAIGIKDAYDKNIDTIWTNKLSNAL